MQNWKWKSKVNLPVIFYQLKNKQASSGGGKNMISIIKCFINPMVVDHKSITMMDTQLDDYITS